MFGHISKGEDFFFFFCSFVRHDLEESFLFLDFLFFCIFIT